MMTKNAALSGDIGTIVLCHKRKQGGIRAKSCANQSFVSHTVLFGCLNISCQKLTGDICDDENDKDDI